MRCLIIFSAEYSLGHANIARQLAATCAADGHDVWLASDQEAVLADISFFSSDTRHLSLAEVLNEREGRWDLIVLESIPFRRRGLVPSLLRMLAYQQSVVICGHTGWLGGWNWAESITTNRHLNSLNVRTVFVYHGEDTCRGRCHVATLARELNFNVVHTGLLLPPIQRLPQRKDVLCVNAGGGAFAEAVWKAALTFSQIHSQWGVHIFRGPYMSVYGSAPSQFVVQPFVANFASRLTEYPLSFAQAGYGSCVDHVVAETPAVFLPLSNQEQMANAGWVKRHLRLTASYRSGEYEISPNLRYVRPLAFSWRSLVEKIWSV